ncbi:MAG: hypothetical protein ACTSSI_07955 [Candidatus Helarchaeota archaeon]
MKLNKIDWLVYFSLIILIMITNIVLILINHLIFMRPLLYSFDITHYISIATTLYLDPAVWSSFQYGYFTHLIFFPLVMRVVFPPNMVVSSYITSMLCWAASGAVFLKICELEGINEKFRPILFIGFMGAFNVFVLFGSTNGLISLMVLLTTAGYYCYRRDFHHVAGLLIGLTAITHVIGIIFPVAYALIMLARRRWVQWLWYIQGGIFLVIHYAYFAFLTGDFFITLTQQGINMREMVVGGYFIGLLFGSRFIIDGIALWTFTIFFFFLIGFSLYYRKNQDLAFIGILNFILIFNWLNALNAIRIMSLGTTLIILNLKVFQVAIEPEAEVSSPNEKKIFKISPPKDLLTYCALLFGTITLFISNYFLYGGIILGMQIFGVNM